MKLKMLAASIMTATLLTACGGSSSSNGGSNENILENLSQLDGKTLPINIANVQKILDSNADIALAAYNDSLSTAQALKTAIDTFAAAPTQANFDAAKEAWLVAREPYGQTEVYRFRFSPIDTLDYDAQDEDGPEGSINAWPLGEALIDQVTVNTGTNDDFGTDQVGVTDNKAKNDDMHTADNQTVGFLDADGPDDIAGNDDDDARAITEAHANSSNRDNIIGETGITINAALLDNTATAGDEHDVIAGYHAIEFLLWGQDLNNNSNVTTGTDRSSAVKAHGASNIVKESGATYSGSRPLADFTEATYGARRLTYLQVAAQKLVDELEDVRDGWVDGVDDNYRDKFTTITTTAQARQKLAEILTGMGTLSEGELAGERMKIAYVNNSQEDEHSCFSDNTHRDVWLNAEGVSNSYYGDYAGYDSTLNGTVDNTTRSQTGYGFDDYLTDVGGDDADLFKKAFDAAFAATKTNYTEIDTEARGGKPFDVLIMPAERSNDNPVAKTILSLNTQSVVISKFATALGITDNVVDPDASECNTGDLSQDC